MRLIDADALRDRLQNIGYDDWNQGVTTTWAEAFKECADMVEEMPTIEPERKKGKWMPHVEKSREYIGTVLANVEYDYWVCDTCGYRVKKRQPTYNFCPNCGADMGEDGDK